MRKASGIQTVGITFYFKFFDSLLHKLHYAKINKSKDLSFHH